MRPAIFIISWMLLIGISACDSGSTFTRATGIAYEVIVVMDKAGWDSDAGEAIKSDLTSPLPYLLQEEPSMRYTYVRPDQFDGLFHYVRNILIVNINKDMYTKATLIPEYDKWARGQCIFYLNSPNYEKIELFLAEYPNIISRAFNDVEMNRTANFLRETYSPVVMEKVKDKFGISLNAPSDIVSFKEGDDCLWFSNDAPSGRMDLLVYSFPYTNRNQFTLDYLVAKRDQITKKMIPGAFPGSYMSTEKRVVDYQSIKFHGEYCGVLRGLWRMEGGDMMGGPFVSYARVDVPNQRVIVTEGFVYEPQKDKRNFIRRLEASLRTTLFPDEQADNSVETTVETAIEEPKKEEK